MFDDFKPDKEKENINPLPFFEEVSAKDGWAGQASQKSIEFLKSNIIMTIAKLKGNVIQFERGTFSGRLGYRIKYVIEGSDGKQYPGYIDVAGLPIKVRKYYDGRRRKTDADRMEESLRMAMYNLDICLAALWRLQQLSPGFAPLMPFMALNNKQNLTQMWSSGAVMKQLMPPAETMDEAIEGEVKEIE